MIATYNQKATALLLFIFLSTSPLFAENRVTDLNQLFSPGSHFLGGDAVVSIPLAKNRVLWLFGDSFVSKTETLLRKECIMARNAIAITNSLTNIQPTYTDEHNHQKSIKYYWDFNQERSKEGSFFHLPTPDNRWFWPLHGIVTQGKLFIFLMEIARTDDSLFGFRVSGNYLATISNFKKSPDQWQIKYKKVKGSSFIDNQELVWGASVLKIDDWLYIYGSSDLKRSKKDIVVARIKIDDFCQNSVASDQILADSWSFYSKECRWSKSNLNLKPLVTDGANEFSVTWHQGLRRFVLLYSQGEFRKDIVVRTSLMPHRSFGKKRVIHTCPEYERGDKTLFCYAGKAHPHLSENWYDLYSVYVCNTTSLKTLFNDKSIYIAKFNYLDIRSLTKH